MWEKSKQLLLWFTAQWTSGLDLRGSIVVVISATFGAIISTFVEFSARGDADSILNGFKEFLAYIFETPLSNLTTMFSIILIGVALCFIFQMKTALAALYGGATVITILTTGLQQRDDPGEYSPEATLQFLTYAVFNESQTFRDGLIYTALEEDSGTRIILCPDNDRQFIGESVDVIWRTYGPSGKFERLDLRAIVSENGTNLVLPDFPGDKASFKYELTVKSENMKTVYTTGSIRKVDKKTAIRVTTEIGHNSFFDWLLQPNVQEGYQSIVLNCR